MKIVKKNVYYCEFCKKKGLNKGIIANHELHCTGNINRKCRMCEKIGIQQKNLSLLVEKYKNTYTIENFMSEGCNEIKVIWKASPVTIDDILDDVGDCPMCALSVLRLSGMNHYYFGEQLKFDFKTYKDGRFSELNAKSEDNFY